MKWKKEMEKIIYSEENNKSEKRLMTIKNKNIPKLYRYFSFSPNYNCLYNKKCTNENNCYKEKKETFDYSYTCLKYNMIGLSSPLDFNDPFDAQFKLSKKFGEKILKNGLENGTYDIDITDEQMKIIKESSDIFKTSSEMFGVDLKNTIEPIEGLMDYSIYTLLNPLKIACFSEVNDSILMWSHYTDNHKGFCVEYDFNKINDINIINDLYPVFYKKSLFDIADIFFKSYTKKEIDKLEFLSPILTKNKEWAYEKEWRYISSEDKYILNIQKQPQNIYLGSRINDKNKNAIISLFKDSDTHIFQMTPDKSQFKLNSIQIDV